MTDNIAALRIRAFLKLSLTDARLQADAEALVDQALAAERRATVERIRVAIEAHVREFATVMPDGQEQGYADCLAILDAEADR